MKRRFISRAPFDAPELRFDSDGWRRCRWCGHSPIEKPRRTLCSDKCSEAIRLALGVAVDELMRKRDKGVCAACGLDCEALRTNWLRAMREFQASQAPGSYAQYHADGWRGWVEFEGRDVRHLCQRNRWWDIDHILEVVRGGGVCGLENLQTLCVWCHKAKTAKLAAERAQERREAREKVKRETQAQLEFGAP